MFKTQKNTKKDHIKTNCSIFPKKPPTQNNNLILGFQLQCNLIRNRNKREKMLPTFHMPKNMWPPLQPGMSKHFELLTLQQNNIQICDPCNSSMNIILQIRQNLHVRFLNSLCRIFLIHSMQTDNLIKLPYSNKSIVNQHTICINKNRKSKRISRQAFNHIQLIVFTINRGLFLSNFRKIFNVKSKLLNIKLTWIAQK